MILLFVRTLLDHQWCSQELMGAISDLSERLDLASEQEEYEQVTNITRTMHVYTSMFKLTVHTVIVLRPPSYSKR